MAEMKKPLNSCLYLKTSIVTKFLDLIYFQNFYTDKIFPKQKSCLYATKQPSQGSQVNVLRCNYTYNE